MSRRATAALLGVQVAFQAGIAAGAPWGPASYGGRHPGRLPVRYRVVSAVAVVGYAAAAVAVVSDRTPDPRRRTVLTGLIGAASLGVVPNAISPSPPERVWSAWCVATVVAAWRARRTTE